MSYYAVLESVNTLISEHNWTLQRCRRHCDGPARYLVLNASGKPVLIDKLHKGRRLGFTLQEVLIGLSENPDTTLAAAASDLLGQLNGLTDYE